MSDPVNNPEHYTKGGIECIDALRASMSDASFRDFCKGNVMKYLWRFEHKNGYEDLCKANKYLQWMMETEKDIEEESSNHGEQSETAEQSQSCNSARI